MDDMRHMEFLEDVTDEDVRELSRKEETYRGSWKRRGGVGAFMMLARKWDRIEGILANLASKYDLFVAIELEPKGQDGTTLAEVRDLRRYLTLVEAEMMARGVVDSGRKHGRRPPEKAIGAELFEKSVHPGTSEDGGHHERNTKPSEPWSIRRLVLESVRPDLQCMWKSHSEENNPLEPWLSDATFQVVSHRLRHSPHDLVEEALRCYRWTPGAGIHLLRIEDAPSELRSMWPALQLELNAHEKLSVENWRAALYEWHEAESKWRLRPEHAAWGAE